jgi:hypothetical protein
MIEFFHVSISAINLPFTVLLILVVLYWTAVIIGAADIDLFDAEWMPDLDADDPGFFGSVLHFLGIGEIPIMVVISLLIVFGWCFSLLSNFYINENASYAVAALLLIPNLIGSIFLTAVIIRPISGVWRRMIREEKESQRIMFREAVVISGEVTPAFGQVQIETKGAPITLNARTRDDVILKKGDRAIIYDQDKEKGVYYVSEYEKKQ